MERESTYGTTALVTMDIGMRTKSMGMAFMFGLTEGGMMVSGKITTCTEREFIPGRMVEGTKGNTSMTGSMVSESILGLTEGNISASGKTESNMEKADTDKLMGKRERACGRTERDSDGQTKPSSDW